MENWREWAVKAAEWGVDYRAGLRDLPVRPNIDPGEIALQIPPTPPERAEDFARIFSDFERIIAPGMTHWQHPRFFAYFPANAAPASVVAEQLMSAIGAVCMLWQTSPAATELETRMVEWMREALDLSSEFSGCIQDTASTATLAAVLDMRERALNWSGNTKGLSGAPRLRVYCSAEAHTSIDRAIWFAGIGADNLVRVPIEGALRSMDCEALERMIETDRAAGYLPAGIIANFGATSVGAIDPLAAVADIAERHKLYLHVDAAWAGVAMMCDEFRATYLWDGANRADSIVTNPHKWLGAQSHCTVHFVRDPASLVRTLAARPDYLHTLGQDEVVNYSEWGIPLGRQFRALKLWFVLRAYGLEGLRAMFRNHVAWSAKLCERIRNTPDFTIVTEPILSLFSFRYERGRLTPDARDALNLKLVETINAEGRIYLTQTRIDGHVVIRFQCGQFDCTEADVMAAYDAITDAAKRV